MKRNDSLARIIRWGIILVFGFLCCPFSLAANRTIDLVVGYKTVYFAGKPRQAIAVNNQIPAPTLHFKQGDHVTINVYNHLNKGTAIHWHGILVPWQMDGVVGVSQKPILPGEVFHYQFTLYQSGTYWYHAHAGLQEQQGLYGAFIIDPPRLPTYRFTKDYVVVLSDWSNTYPEKIYRNLKKDGDYYSPKFPLQPSLMHFIRSYRRAHTPQERHQVVADYMGMQKMRMGIYDLSDIAYDAFLLNGQPKTNPWTAPVKLGDVVRLRFIGASASTNFHVKIPNASMQVVQVEGNDVAPYWVHDFWITPGETYDVLVKIEKHGPYIIYAESADTIGAAYGALVTAPQQTVSYQQVTPFPEPEPVTRQMMQNEMQGMRGGHGEMTGMSHHAEMQMPTEPTIKNDVITPAVMTTVPSMTTGTKYQNLTAAVKTNDPSKPVNPIRMELFGYMGRYIWFINGRPEYKAKPIVIEPGKRYRIIFTNNSMMHHPMHIHGHWFILRNGHGSYDPLLHTIDVAPGSTVVADFDTDASGQWFFHCHHLYHMVAGMARVWQYSTLINLAKADTKPESVIKQLPYRNRAIVREDTKRPLDYSLIQDPMPHPPGRYLANFLDVGEDPFNNVQQLTFKSLFGGDYHKIELFANDAEMDQGTVENADLDIFYWHLINQFWAVKGGVNYFYRPSETAYWQPGIGIEGLMPYFIDTDVRLYYRDGSIKFDIELSRDTQITNNFFIRAGIRAIAASKTVATSEIASGLNQLRFTVRPYYRITPQLSLFSEFEHQQDYGVFKDFEQAEEDTTSENTLTFGVSILF